MAFLRSDLAKAFRGASFAGKPEARAFLDKHSGAGASEVAKLLPIIIELTTRQPGPSHQLRCAVFDGLARAAPSPELFSPCLKALRQSDDLLTRVLVELLPTVNDVSAHAELCDLLGTQEAALRSAAASVLAQIGGKSALEYLAKRSLEPNFQGRMDAMTSLGPRAGQHALPLFSAVLQAGKPLEKIHALSHLGDRERFRDPGLAIAAVRTALADPEDLVLAQAITTLGLLGADDLWDQVEPRLRNRGIEVLKAFLLQIAKRPSEESGAMLRDRFRAGPKNVRLAVLEAIETSGSEHFLPTLIEGLSHRDVALRSRAAHVLTELSRAGRIDAPRAVVWLLKSRDVNVRRLAAEIATQIGDEDGSLAQTLLKSLRDEDWWVRERVLDALVEMNTPSVTKHLVKDYLADRSSVVRRFAVNALTRLGDKRALGALVRTAQEDPDWLVSEAAVDAIGKLGDERANAYLISLMQTRSELRVACLQSLRKLKAVEAIEDVVEFVQDEDSEVRAAAISLLDELDDGSHALWVKGCEDDAVPAVREAADRLLRRYSLHRAEEGGGISDLKSLDFVLANVAELGADDLFLIADRHPYIKRRGKVEVVGDSIFSPEHIRLLVEPHLSQEQLAALEAGKEVDFSYQLNARGMRFRVNIFRQRTGLAAVFRSVRNDIIALADLGLPEVMTSFAQLANGLVLVGGPTGAGKSTTLAALVDHINNTDSRHIITIEDPIEVVHQRKKCLINQRELGPHMRSFSSALRSALRQDPDVILVGELRDLETIAFAVSAAETGHLVLGTVHTTTADATVDRMINAFPARQQGQVRSMLAESLRAITCQYLLSTPDGGRMPVVEVMIANEAVSALIRKGKNFQIPTAIAMGREAGMQLMDTELIRLARDGKIVVEEAYAKSIDKRSFEAALGLPSSDAEDGRGGDERGAVSAPSQAPHARAPGRS